jgi:hypothetical protein
MQQLGKQSIDPFAQNQLKATAPSYDAVWYQCEME